LAKIQVILSASDLATTAAEKISSQRNFLRFSDLEKPGQAAALGNDKTALSPGCS
jgi:hypothetical protein